MVSIFAEYDGLFLGGLEKKIDSFSLQIRQQRVPDFLMPGEIFLGKYMIIDIIPYTKIYREKLMTGKSVFGKVVPAINKGGSQKQNKAGVSPGF